MSKDKWVVYSIKRIDSIEAPTFVTIKGPIVLTTYNSSLASALIKLGHREFYWEQSGEFDARYEAREIREKMIHDWTINQSERIIIVPIAVEEIEKLKEVKHKPRIVRPCTLDTIEAFMSAAANLLKINSDRYKNYIINHDADEITGPPRKTDEQKELSKIKRDMRNKQSKLLIKFSKLSTTDKKRNEHEYVNEEDTVVSNDEPLSLKDCDEDLKLLVSSRWQNPWDQ